MARTPVVQRAGTRLEHPWHAHSTALSGLSSDVAARRRAAAVAQVDPRRPTVARHILVDVASMMTRLTSAALALVLSGTPVSLAACVAACLPGMSHGAEPAAIALRATAADDARVATANGHHHAMSADDPAPATVPEAGVAGNAPAPPLASMRGVECHACCPDAGGWRTVSAPAVRADAQMLAATAPTPIVMLRFASARRVARVIRSAVAGRLRSRTSLVLRI